MKQNLTHIFILNDISDLNYSNLKKKSISTIEGVIILIEEMLGRKET